MNDYKDRHPDDVEPYPLNAYQAVSGPGATYMNLDKGIIYIPDANTYGFAQHHVDDVIINTLRAGKTVTVSWPRGGGWNKRIYAEEREHWANHRKHFTDKWLI